MSPFDSAPLILAATPIGNPDDATARLVAALAQADLIACEDTRRTRDLAKRLGIQLTARLVAYHEHNEAELTARLLEAVQRGSRVLQVTDAGMPGVSDPGFRLAREAAAANITFTVLPGPSAPTLALVMSGLPTDTFTFVGFLPRKSNAMERSLQSLRNRYETLIFLESPRRVRETIATIARVFGANRPAGLARELTKTHEEMLRGTLGELEAELDKRGEVRGEFVIVVAGAPKAESQAVDPDLVEKMEQLVQSGVRAKEAAKIVAEWFGTSANRLYRAGMTDNT